MIEFSIRYKKNQINFLDSHSYCIRLHFNQLKVYQFTFVLLFIDIACVFSFEHFSLYHTKVLNCYIYLTIYKR